VAAEEEDVDQDHEPTSVATYSARAADRPTPRLLVDSCDQMQAAMSISRRGVREHPASHPDAALLQTCLTPPVSDTIPFSATLISDA